MAVATTTHQIFNTNGVEETVEHELTGAYEAKLPVRANVAEDGYHQAIDEGLDCLSRKAAWWQWCLTDTERVYQYPVDQITRVPTFQARTH